MIHSSRHFNPHPNTRAQHGLHLTPSHRPCRGLLGVLRHRLRTTYVQRSVATRSVCASWRRAHFALGYPNLPPFPHTTPPPLPLPGGLRLKSSGDDDMSIKAARQEPASSPPPRPHLFALSPEATVTVATGGGASPPRPAPVHLGQGWMQYFDDDTGRSYYHNYCTHAAGQWARPPGL